MEYGICHLSIVPVRFLPDDKGEMVTQLLYGEHVKILERRKAWSRIRISFDGSEGWISNIQITVIDKEGFDHIEKSKNTKYASDLVSFVEVENAVLLPIVLGSQLNNSEVLPHKFDGNYNDAKPKKSNLVRTAMLYLNAPYLWGGRTPFGVDCAGLTQMVYKLNARKLLRSAAEQATQGTSLSFIEEGEAGDLAFFDNNEGQIHHVGIIMNNNYIIHADGKVRIDRIDHTGIFNTEIGKYTHQLRVIKQIF